MNHAMEQESWHWMMGMKNWKNGTAALALAALGLFCTPASATTVLPMNLAQMSEVAESAFVIQVKSVETTRTRAGSFDLVSGIVMDAVFGDVVTSQAISWKQYRPGMASALPGMPSYEAGREYLVFLSGKGRGTHYQMPVGLGQGAFSLVRNRATGVAMARNGFGNATLATRLDVRAVTTDMVAVSTATRSLNPQARRAAQARLQEQLRPRPTGNSLEALKSAARFFHEQKTRGRMASREYLTSAPVQLLH